VDLTPGFKQTDIGPIPEDWDVKPLGALLTDGRLGGNYPNSPTESPFPLMKMGNLGRGKFDCSRLEYITPPTIPDSTHRLRHGDVLLNTRNTLDLVGKVGMWRDELPIAFYNSNLIRLEFDRGVVSSNAYANYALNAAGSIARLRALATGTTSVAAIYTRDLRELPLLLPPMREQEAIASALGDVDALLAELTRLVTKKRDLKQTAMQQLLTGQTRLEGFGPRPAFKSSTYGPVPSDWQLKPLSSVSRINGRIGWQGLRQEEFTDSPDDPFLITGMNFRDGVIRWNEVYHLPEARYCEAPAIQLAPGDVLMTKDGTIGKLLFVDQIPYPGKASLNSHLLVFRPINGQYVPKYLYYHFGTPRFTQHIELYKSGSTFFGLTQAAVGRYEMVLPSIVEQTTIAEVLSDMDAELAALEARLEKTKAIKQAMMQELLTGRTRLVALEPADA
jgi:type I restriction enzyme, S subunit